MIFLGSIFQFHKLSVLLVAVLINFVKKQVPQVSFKTAAGDLISFHNFGSDMNPFRYDLISDIILFSSNFKIQELLFMLVSSLTNFGVKNQVPQFFFKIYAGVFESISDYGAQAFALHSPKASLSLVTCSSPHSLSLDTCS